MAVTRENAYRGTRSNQVNRLGLTVNPGDHPHLVDGMDHHCREDGIAKE
jgi:hypothetical protein